MKVHWKVAPHLRAGSAPVAAIICKSCGHIELVLRDYANIDPHQHRCPHCRAIYYYRLTETDGPQSFTCQNCGKNFQVQDPEKFNDIIDEIEENLREE